MPIQFNPATFNIGSPIGGNPTASGLLYVGANNAVASGPATTDGSGNVVVPGSITVTNKIIWSGNFVAISDNTSGVVEINNTSGGTFRDLVLRTLNVGATDTFINRAAAANILIGGFPVDTAPVAQTLSVQNTLAGGTSNVAGANFTIAGSQGKGTGVGGSLMLVSGRACGIHGNNGQCACC